MPAATSCSVGCASSVSTGYLGRMFNGALLSGGAGSFFTSNADGKSPSSRARNCSSEHRVEVREHRCTRGLRSRAATPLLATITSALPQRTCMDMLNYRGNGPEDARVLPLPTAATAAAAAGHHSHSQRALLLFVDYVERTEPIIELIRAQQPPHKRGMHIRILSVAATAPLSASLGPLLRVTPSSAAVVNLSSIEKNWCPFALSTADAPHAGIYVQQWLDNGRGLSVTLRLDETTGVLLERYESPVPFPGQQLLQLSERLAHVAGELSLISSQLSANSAGSGAPGHRGSPAPSNNVRQQRQQQQRQQQQQQQQQQ